MRQLIAIARRVAAEGTATSAVVQEYIDGAEQAVYQLARTPQGAATQPIAQVLQAAFEQITRRRRARRPDHQGALDRVPRRRAGHGQAPCTDGDLSIIAPAPARSKGDPFVLNLAVNVASPAHRELPGARPVRGTASSGTDPGFGAARLLARDAPRAARDTSVVCSEGRVDVGKLRQGFLQPDDWRRLTEAASFLSTPAHLDRRHAGHLLLELRAKVRAHPGRVRPAAQRSWQLGRRIGLIVIDYLQLMKGRTA